MTKTGSSEILGEYINLFPKRSLRNVTLKMCSDKFLLKHALAYSAITFIIAALAAYLLFYNL